jgi:membrane-bound ClpP family serine protease
VPQPLRGAAVEALLVRLNAHAASLELKSGDTRPLVVLRFGRGAQENPTSLAVEANPELGGRFSDALSLARFLTSTRARVMRTVAYLEGPVEGHAVLAVLACDEFIVSSSASLGRANRDETEVDEATRLVYGAIAAGKGVIPPLAVQAMLDPTVTLVEVTDVEGNKRFVDRSGLEELRGSGQASREQQLTDGAATAVFSATQLRDFRWASQIAEDERELKQALGVGRLIVEGADVGGVVRAVRFDLRGPTTGERIRRVTSNLDFQINSQDVNRVLLVIDSPGGSLASNLTLSGRVSSLRTASVGVAGYLENEARGDASLLAISCKPLWMHPQARLGGDGAERITPAEIESLSLELSEIAANSGRSAALVRGLLDTSLDVNRCIHKRTGEVAFFVAGEEPGGAEGSWRVEDRVELGRGLTAQEAVELGLAEGIVEDVAMAAAQTGLDTVPPLAQERPLVQWVERLGQKVWLGYLLLFLGWMTLMMEMNSPGLGLPGFCSAICFMFFFWTKMAGGTAEWFEIILFVGGVAFILVEVLVIPGFGIFGIGGLLMVTTAIVLASQTFVIPYNSYQVQQTIWGLGSMLAVLAGLVVGVLTLRYVLPSTPVYRELVMPGPNSMEMIEQEVREHLVHFDYLLGNEGEAVTPLLPGGKARFGDQVVAVVSEGAAIAAGEKIRVMQVQGNRIVVEQLEQT